VNNARVTKHDLDILSNLVFDSYVVREFEIVEYFFTIRSLTTKERESISRKFRHLSSKYNIKLVLEILSSAILYVNGFDFDKEKHQFFLSKLNSRLILKIYSKYQELDSEVSNSSKFIDYYIETKESRNMWTVFKTCSRVQEPFSIRSFNQYQFYWIVMNVFKDSLEEEKRSWSKVEYMTNSICAFVNPKAFRKSNGDSIVEQLERHEDKSKQKVIEELEGNLEKKVVETNDVFSSMERLPDETEEQHEERVNVLMEKTLKGELIDEHDRIVRKSEIEFLKKFLREKRIQVLVERELLSRRGESLDSDDILENEVLKIQLEEDKKLGFFHDDFSFLEIVRMKDFAAVSKKEKEKAFEEVMSEEIDIEKEVDRFLKSLSEKQDIEEGGESDFAVNEYKTMMQGNDDDSQSKTDQEDVLEHKSITAAQKAASMNVNIQEVDLIKQRKEKIKRKNEALDKRNDQNLDVMKFE